MTDKVKHSTSYYHEAIAHAFEMFKNGYEPVMETPFQPRRLGSAFVTEYKPVRESLDDDPRLTIQQKWEIDDELAVINMTEEQSKAISDRGKETRLKRLHEKYDQSEGDAYYFLTLLEKDIEQEEALNELAAQAQELGMYDADNHLAVEANGEKQPSRDIFKEIMEGIKEMQENPEGCVSTIVGVDEEQVKVYSKSELDEMHWNELKPILDSAGIRGRRRANLIRDFLKKQEEQ